MVRRKPDSSGLFDYHLRPEVKACFEAGCAFVMRNMCKVTAPRYDFVATLTGMWDGFCNVAHFGLAAGADKWRLGFRSVIDVNDLAG